MEVFRHLKRVFNTTTVLKHPDPYHQFMVDVNASDVGVGTVLSQ